MRDLIGMLTKQVFTDGKVGGKKKPCLTGVLNQGPGLSFRESSMNSLKTESRHCPFVQLCTFFWGMEVCSFNHILKQVKKRESLVVFQSFQLEIYVGVGSFN